MDGQARLVVEAREDVRIELAEMARGEAAVIAEALAPAARRLRHLPVRRPGGAGRGRPTPLVAALECPLFLVR